MMRIILFALMIASLCSCLIAEEPAWAWEKTIEVSAGQTVDLFALCEPGFSYAEAHIDSGEGKFNGIAGYVDCSWVSDAKAELYATTDCVVSIRGR